MPSGHVPVHTLAHPEQFAGLNCLILVPTEALKELHKILKEDVGSYEDHMSWYSQYFCQLADETYAKLSHPAITLDNAWKIFQSKYWITYLQFYEENVVNKLNAS